MLVNVSTNHDESIQDVLHKIQLVLNDHNSINSLLKARVRFNKSQHLATKIPEMFQLIMTNQDVKYRM